MDSATTVAVPAVEVDFDVLIAARHELDRVKLAMSDDGWKAEESLAAYHIGRTVEACDSALDAISNALISMAIFGKVEGGSDAVNRMNDKPKSI